MKRITVVLMAILLLSMVTASYCAPAINESALINNYYRSFLADLKTYFPVSANARRQGTHYNAEAAYTLWKSGNNKQSFEKMGEVSQYLSKYTDACKEIKASVPSAAKDQEEGHFLTLESAFIFSLQAKDDKDQMGDVIVLLKTIANSPSSFSNPDIQSKFTEMKFNAQKVLRTMK